MKTNIKMPSLACLMMSLMAVHAYSQNPGEEKAIEAIIRNFHQGFVLGNELLIKNSSGNTLIMFNGNFSDDQREWQPHMSLDEKEVVEWASWMIQNAGPHTNRIEVKSVKFRQNAALVVTEESGSNKFRTWTDQTVTYLLSKREEKWGITGFFIRNIKNPG